ncbi:MAG TPA: hypothetical protein VIS49_07125 [Cyclobacteriaceae bacterium]
MDKFYINRIIVGMVIVICLFSYLLSGCAAEEPFKEDIPELITKVVLTFEPLSAGTNIVVIASDPDGDGVKDITVDAPINLQANTSYILTLSLLNELAEMSSPAYNITDEVEEEGDEHMFFYTWTGNVFSDPAGNGNIDNRLDVVNYIDEDVDGLPVGINTFWTTGTASSGTFRIVLKHQPQLKSTISGADTGETDLDVEFEININ